MLPPGSMGVDEGDQVAGRALGLPPLGSCF
jgi:hypothetical protein